MGIFTRKRQPLSNEQLRSQAANKAYWNTKMKFGRAPQAKVKNILQTPGEVQKTNEAAVYQQNLINKFVADLSEEVSKYPKEEVKSGLEEVVKQIEESLGRSKDAITITIPNIVAKILKGILKILIGSITILFVIAMAVLGGNSGVSATTTMNGTLYLLPNTRKEMNKQPGKNVNEPVNWRGGSRKTRRNKN